MRVVRLRLEATIEVRKAAGRRIRTMGPTPLPSTTAASVSSGPGGSSRQGAGGAAAPRTVRAPRGTAISCRGWQQEAALRMLMNNLDPEVA